MLSCMNILLSDCSFSHCLSSSSPCPSPCLLLLHSCLFFFFCGPLDWTGPSLWLWFLVVYQWVCIWRQWFPATVISKGKTICLVLECFYSHHHKVLIYDHALWDASRLCRTKTCGDIHVPLEERDFPTNYLLSWWTHQFPCPWVPWACCHFSILCPFPDRDHFLFLSLPIQNHVHLLELKILFFLVLSSWVLSHTFSAIFYKGILRVCLPSCALHQGHASKLSEPPGKLLSVKQHSVLTGCISCRFIDMNWNPKVIWRSLKWYLNSKGTGTTK